jgi:hypothetical protein
VQDDRAIIAANPAAHSVAAAVRAFDDPYWPRESGAGLYRPLTILSFAVDWTVSNGRAGWLHVMNALWHGLATVLFALVIGRWISGVGWVAATLIFAWHPVHVEAVAGLVGRAELLAAVGILGSVLAARRGLWVSAVALAALAMLSKEHGVIAGVAILLDRWLKAPEGRPYPLGLWIGLGAVTAGFLVIWSLIGRAGASDVAPVFLGRDVFGRLAVALPAVLRAATLLVWPASLSVDYGPQVIPARDGMSLAAVLGAMIVVGIPALVVWGRRRAPAIAFAAGVAGLSYLPTANLLFPSGVVLAERNLYLAVMLPAAAVGVGIAWLAARWGERARVAAIAVSAVLVVACAAKSLDRLPAWRDNRGHLLTLLDEHPESSRAHASAAAVLGGIKDTAGARREYRTADSLFSGDPFVTAAQAILLLSLGDTGAAGPLVARLRGPMGPSAQLVSLRVRFLASLSRADTARARALAAEAAGRAPWEESWYRQYLQ